MKNKSRGLVWKGLNKETFKKVEKALKKLEEKYKNEKYQNS
jgi:hypothetical protein